MLGREALALRNGEDVRPRCDTDMKLNCLGGNEILYKIFEGSFSAVSTPNIASKIIEILNSRWEALDEIYTMNTLLHRSKHKITKILHEIVCKTLTIFHALQFVARAFPESVIFLQ